MTIDPTIKQMFQYRNGLDEMITDYIKNPTPYREALLPLLKDEKAAVEEWLHTKTN